MSEAIWFIDTLVTVHLGPEDTDGRYDLVETLAPSGHQPPPHVHATEDEGFMLLEGELTVTTEDGVTVLRPGDSINGSAGRPHAIQVTSPTPARWLNVTQPAGFAAFARAFGTPADRPELPVLDGPPDLARLTEVAAAHGITFVDRLVPA
jgi:mannose-6-phosphate isomerase-like protein (cupin superfamily)